MLYSICAVVQNRSSTASEERGAGRLGWAGQDTNTAIEPPSSRRTARLVSLVVSPDLSSLHVRLFENIARDCIHIADWSPGCVRMNRIHTARVPITSVVRGIVIEI